MSADQTICLQQHDIRCCVFVMLWTSCVNYYTGQLPTGDVMHFSGYSEIQKKTTKIMRKHRTDTQNNEGLQIQITCVPQLLARKGCFFSPPKPYFEKYCRPINTDPDSEHELGTISPLKWNAARVWKAVTHPPARDWTAAAVPWPCSPPGPSHTPLPHMTSPAYWPLEHRHTDKC